MRLAAASALLLSLAIAPAVAHASKDVSDQDLKATMTSWAHRCRDYAVGEARPELQDRCMQMVYRDVAEVDELRQDPTISDQIWNMCRMESGFSRTGDFHDWAACMRVAKTRPWLRAQ